MTEFVAVHNLILAKLGTVPILFGTLVARRGNLDFAGWF